MKYSITNEGNECYRIRFLNPPEYCHALGMAPEEIEPNLIKGNWIILLVAVWSGPDRAAVDFALKSMDEMKDKNINLGVRPFNMHSEISKWCAEAKEKWRSPVWLWLKDGKLVDEKSGLLTENSFFAATFSAFQIASLLRPCPFEK